MDENSPPSHSCPISCAHLWERVDASGDCWQWIGGKDRDGYGNYTPTGDTARIAHRYVWEHLAGPIPNGHTLDHLCRNRACVNPDHLEPVTLRQNIMRGQSISAQNARKTHCKRGHPFDEANTARIKTKNGWGRRCRACRKIIG